MTGSIVFDPLLPWAIVAIAVLATLAAVGVGLGTVARVTGLGACARWLPLVVLAALAQPSYQIEDRAPLSNIVLIVRRQKRQPIAWRTA